MFSQTAEYALRATVALAQEPDRPLTAAQIAERTKVPAGYLSKVLQKLARKGVIRASRGLHGGYRLQRPASHLTILEVLSAVEPSIRIRMCPITSPEDEGGLCPLHQRLDDALKQVELALGGSTLAALVGGPATSAAPCPGSGHTQGLQ